MNSKVPRPLDAFVNAPLSQSEEINDMGFRSSSWEVRGCPFVVLELACQWDLVLLSCPLGHWGGCFGSVLGLEPARLLWCVC